MDKVFREAYLKYIQETFDGWQAVVIREVRGRSRGIQDGNAEHVHLTLPRWRNIHTGGET